MGWPFAEATWNAAEGAAYYVGAGSTETLWLIVSIVLCIAALAAGGKHEADAYRRKGNGD